MKQVHGRYLLQPNKDFPLDCETFDALQTNMHIISILGNIAGDKAILLKAERAALPDTCSSALRRTPRGKCSAGKAEMSLGACISKRR